MAELGGYNDLNRYMQDAQRYQDELMRQHLIGGSVGPRLGSNIPLKPQSEDNLVLLLLDN